MNPRAERLLQHSNIYNQANTESVSQNDTHVCQYTPSTSCYASFPIHILADLNNTVVLSYFIPQKTSTDSVWA